MLDFLWWRKKIVGSIDAEGKSGIEGATSSSQPSASQGNFGNMGQRSGLSYESASFQAPQSAPQIPVGEEEEVTGLDDRPSKNDLLNMEPYARGLANFVAQCRTPMTVSIQGSWGSGKTSTMQMIQEVLASEDLLRKPTVINFDAWQHATAETPDGIIAEMVRTILAPLEQPEQKERKRVLLKRLASVGKVAAEAGFRSAAALFGGSIAGSAVNAGLDEFRSSSIAAADEEKAADLDLRQEFSELIKQMSDQARAEARNPRVIVFVDDLDRLQPLQAIEVMEALKSILDVENCVFVLAVDFDVVVTGVQQKYPSIDHKKARDFFDKIIQLPFNMPTGEFDIHGYLESSIEDIGIPLASVDIARVEGIATAAFGNNPRAIKRLLNSYALLREIETLKSDNSEANASPDDSDATQQIAGNSIMLGILALQSRFPLFYESLVSHPAEGKDKDQDAKIARSIVSARAAKELSVEWGVEDGDSPRFKALLGQLEQVLENGGERLLGEVVAITRVTQVTSSFADERFTPGDFAYSIEDRLKRLDGQVGAHIGELAKELEDKIRVALDGAPFSVLGQAGKGNEWTLDAVTEEVAQQKDGKSTARWGLMKMSKGSISLQLEGGAKVDPQQWRDVESATAEIIKIHGLKRGSTSAKNRILLNGISSSEQVDAAVRVAVLGYRARAEARKS